MKKAILFVHGRGGNASEVEGYRNNIRGYDLFGVDYTEELPWIVCEQIHADYERLTQQYDEIALIANSIGAFFSMLALQDCDISKACFISPILDMERLITDMMCWAAVNEGTLKQKGEIVTDFGTTLSWEYLCYVRRHPIVWTIPTEILYAGGDTLTSRQTVDAFASAHNAHVTVMENGEHWFHTKEQLAVLDAWMQNAFA